MSVSRQSLARLAGLVVLLVGVFIGSARAQGEPAADAAATPGRLVIILMSALDEPLPGASVDVNGTNTPLDASGKAALSVPAGVYNVIYRVPKAALPAVPTNDAEWRVSVPDVAVSAGLETQVDVALSESGGFVRMEVRAQDPQVPAQNMAEEHAAAADAKGVGTVQGNVVTSAEQAAVDDARVYVRGAPVETVTDTGGNFRLQLPAGTHQLWIIHPDFSTHSAKVDVKAGASARVEAQLNPRSPTDEFLITAPHVEGGIAALNTARRETTAVADVIGAEQMSRAGSSNAAAALSRVTGLTIVDGKYVIVRGMGERYSTLLVNRLQVPSPDPTRRVVPLDLFPAGILESVTVQKSYSPDMPGEFGGGTVQIRTRSYPDKLAINLSLATGGNQQALFRNRLSYEGGNTDWLGVDDGTRQLPDAFNDPRGKIIKKGVLGNGYDPEEIAALGKELPNNYKTNRTRTPPDLIISASVGDKYRLRFADLGYVAAVGYKNEFTQTITDPLRRINTNDVADQEFKLRRYGNQVSLNAFLDWGVEFSKAHKLKFTSILLRQTDDDTYYRTGLNVEALSRFTRLSWIERQVLSQQVGGSHTFAKLHDFQVDWRYAYSHAKRVEPDRRDYEYLNTGDNGAYRIENSGGLERLFGDASDQSHEGQIDLTQPVGIWSGGKAKLKGGALAYNRSRDSTVRRFTYDTNGAAFNDLVTRPPDQLFDPNGPAGSTFRETTNSSDSYEAKMNIFAGYAMVEAPILKKLDLMAGARLEKATIDVDTFDAFNAGNPVRASLDNLDVLPAATLTYRFIKDWQARAGYSRTLNRPDFRELSESNYSDVETNALLRGNAALKRARIDNVDARLEWYYTTDEVFSVGGFAKFFDDPIESTVLTGADFVYSWANAPKGYTYGFEIEGRKRFDFISQALESLYLAANLTLIRSEVEVQRNDQMGTRTRPMAAQSPYVVNIQLGWDDSAEGGSGTAVSLLYNTFGKRLRFVASEASGLDDIYEMPIHSLDFVASQNLKHGFKVGLRLRNLLNAQVRWKQGDAEVRSFRRGADGQINASWSY